ncbi:hypothetical protein CVT26_006688 [Gymnopilus dilepis]|uniref:4Fe-4S ferredoxin-type domain-containing protein n=1 Tax=Gymnopilus dilepis TaxID=231916 RepID=A0A409Y2Q4_9AGAR|nr:hypothetical protein CVT26_006688 [Gymnopilus dilepis]
MPQAAKKDAQSQRAQDKESKRARGMCFPASRASELTMRKVHCLVRSVDGRLKLKCDKTVPCSSCKRRGCSAICPNGSLITGQGTRFVLADTETLHQKIATMSDRIRQLEDALAILHSTVAGPAGDPHPLLHRDLLKIKSSIELHSASSASKDDPPRPEEDEEDGNVEQYIDAFGTLAIRDDGAATFYGRSAGSEGEVASPDSAYASPTPSEPSPPQSSSSFTSSSLSLSPSTTSSPLVTLQTLATSYLPPYGEALRLVNLYLEQAPWFFGAVTQRQIESELLPLWYAEAAAAAPLAPAIPAGGLDPSTTGSGPITNGPPPPPRVGTSHDLALLFVVFCFGFLTDTNLPAAPDNAPAEKYYQLTKAALTLDPAAIAGATDPKTSRNGILERPPSVATVQTLSLMAIYEGICSGENSIESTWALMGLACKLSQNRDCARWKLTPAEVQKRRALFWELFITDCWQSLATGRLATFSLPFVDCELPSDPDQTIADDGSIQPSFPYWKARFGAECVSAVVQGTLTSRAPKYSIILDLDRKVRDMELPAYAQGPPPQGLGLAQTMSHFMPQNYRELTLLYIHRCFFAHAISTNPLDPIKSQYAPSFLAGYRSACTILASIKLQFSMFPAQIARFWVLWTHAFSASVMLASVATHSSRSKIAPAALLELRMACDLFESASSFGGRAGKFLPIMRRLQSKAQAAFRDANNGVPAVLPNDIFKPSQQNDTKDELSIFSGKTHTVSTKLLPSGGTSATHSSATSSRGSSKALRAASDSPKSFADYPAFANAHPSLVSELNAFHGNIKTQIQNAYRDGDLFSGMAMAEEERRELERQELARQKQLQEQQEIQRQHEEAHRQQQLLQQQEVQRQQAEQEALRQQQRQMEFDHRQRLESHQQYQHAQERLDNQQSQHTQQLQQMAQPRYHPQVSAYDVTTQQQPAYSETHNAAPHLSTNASMQSTQMPQHSQNQRTHNVESAYQSYQQYYQPDMAEDHSAGLLHTQHPQHQQPTQYQHPHASSHSSATNSDVVMSVSVHGTNQHQQPTYAVAPGYSHHASPESAHSSSSSAGPTPPSTSYGQARHSSAVMSGPYVPQPSQSYAYWPAAATAFALPAQQQTTVYAPSGHSNVQLYAPQQQYQQYTPEGALRGIAADDRSLQETWQSYMNNVSCDDCHPC